MLFKNKLIVSKINIFDTSNFNQMSITLKKAKCFIKKGLTNKRSICILKLNIDTK